MHHALLLTLSTLWACSTPAPVPEPEPVVINGVHLDTVAPWLEAMGTPVERVRGVLRTVRTHEHGTYAVHVQVFEADQLVLLQTSALATLGDAGDERGIVRLLTQLATQNYALDTGKLQLNPATGEVLLSIELETNDGLGRATFERAVHDLTRAAERMGPLLHNTASAPTP